ncbi:MFS transporter [Yersinia mollaretii]|uniref:MFS transporter n=2 Tax=Yersinia mollaretii TaxID=33060 RepID=A0AA44HYU9_YERMO|nr:MFS transporter [Yersinia mollaretii]NIL21571.1 MFS transporter [Yersinia mollaretii]
MKWKFRLGAVAGNTLEYYDIAVFAAISMYLSAEFARQGYQNPESIVWGIFALRFITRPLGGYIIGHYADRVGRKSALILTSSVTGVATLCMALLPIDTLGYYAPLVVLLLQMTLSLSFGGEIASLTTYLYDDPATHERARICSLIVGSSLIGVLASLIIVYALERTLDSETMQTIGWRIPLLLGIVNIAVSFWFRVKLPRQSIMTHTRRINWADIMHICLIMAPATTVFYAQNMSMSIIRESLHIGNFKSLYAVFSTSLFLCLLMLTGWLADKYASAEKVYSWGVYSLMLFSAPLYLLLSSTVFELVLLAQLFITANAAMILCGHLSIIAKVADGHTATMGVGCNISISLLGGMTPLIIDTLLPYGLIYAGIYISLSGFALLLSYWIFKTRY